MTHFVTIIHVVVCVLLVLVVLLQQGKKDGMGSAFGGGSQSVFGARGAETFLEKLTKVLAIVFMCTSLGLVYLSSRTSSESILSDEQTAPSTTTPGATENSPSAATPAPETPASNAAPAPATK